MQSLISVGRENPKIHVVVLRIIFPPKRSAASNHASAEEEGSGEDPDAGTLTGRRGSVPLRDDKRNIPGLRVRRFLILRSHLKHDLI